MRKTRVAVLGLMAMSFALQGCTTLREVPRAQFGDRAERRSVRAVTRDGLVYEFDYAQFLNDTLAGTRVRTEVAGPAEQVLDYRIAFDDLQSVSVRGIDWRRTGVIGGAVVAGVAVWGLKRSPRVDASGNTSGGGKNFTP